MKDHDTDLISEFVNEDLDKPTEQLDFSTERHREREKIRQTAVIRNIFHYRFFCSSRQGVPQRLQAASSVSYVLNPSIVGPTTGGFGHLKSKEDPTLSRETA